MTTSDSVIEYWAVYTEANDTIIFNEFAGEFEAHRFKRTMENGLKERGEVGKVWIKHGEYDRSIYPNHSQDALQGDWDIPFGESIVVKG
jgi:hypothetical protein